MTDFKIFYSSGTSFMYALPSFTYLMYFGKLHKLQNMLLLYLSYELYRFLPNVLTILACFITNEIKLVCITFIFAFFTFCYYNINFYSFNFLLYRIASRTNKRNNCSTITEKNKGSRMHGKSCDYYVP